MSVSTRFGSGLKRMLSTASPSSLLVTQPKDSVFLVELNRPEKRNAINKNMWKELKECFEGLAANSDCRAVVLSGAGKLFCAGIDIGDLSKDLLEMEGDPARKAFQLRTLIAHLQDCITAIELCPKPVIAAVHSGCIGGGVDIITACDVRYCSRDSYFEIKEVDIGLAADVGTLQRLPKIVGNQSLVRELCFTGRRFFAADAQSMGLTSAVWETREETIAAAVELAAVIASKSPVAVQGTKINLNYSRDHSVAEGLQHMTTWNAAMLQTSDMAECLEAIATKRVPRFSKL